MEKVISLPLIMKLHIFVATDILYNIAIQRRDQGIQQMGVVDYNDMTGNK